MVDSASIVIASPPTGEALALTPEEPTQLTEESPPTGEALAPVVVRGGLVDKIVNSELSVDSTAATSELTSVDSADTSEPMDVDNADTGVDSIVSKSVDSAHSDAISEPMSEPKNVDSAPSDAISDSTVERETIDNDDEPEVLIKSDERVKKHGEVFTPRWMVDWMLDQEGVREALVDPYATFLEPAAGNGNFLVTILERKLAAVDDKWGSVLRDRRGKHDGPAVSEERHARGQYEDMALWALSSIYGIELMDDNVAESRERMEHIFTSTVGRVTGETLDPDSDVARTARLIIHSNIIQGNMLSMKTSEGKPIVMSWWNPIRDNHLIRASIVNCLLMILLARRAGRRDISHRCPSYRGAGTSSMNGRSSFPALTQVDRSGGSNSRLLMTSQRSGVLVSGWGHSRLGLRLRTFTTM